MSTPSQDFIDDFLSSPNTQRWIADALDYCAKLSAAVAETHGFHEDEKTALSCTDIQDTPLVPWLSSQLLTAEFGRVMSEAGEAIENIRKPGPDSHLPEFPGWHVEAIDILIRVFDLLGKRGVQPGEIFVAKTTFNNSRPRKHGKTS